MTINDVLKHESGLAWFTESIPIKNLWTENIKENKTGQIIEKQGLHFIKDAPERNGSKVEYHAITRGAIINEVVRRADPKGRTMDEIIREDIGIDGIFVALKESEKARSVKVNQPSMNDLLKKALNPANSDVKLGDLLRLMKFFKGALGGGDPTQAVFAAEQASNPMALDIHANDDAFAKAEVSSCFAQANARGLAKLASKMADKDGGFISKEVWNDMHSEPDLKYFGVFPEGPLRVNFTKGGLNYFKDFEKNLSLADEILNKGRNGYYGWFGYGGSVLQWNPELKIGFAFCPTYLNYMELSNARGAKLQGIVADCCK